MKIEQRIGRIDRIGQKHKEILVLNLCYAGSAEEEVYGRLLDRLVQTNMIVGTQQISLLPVEPDDFRALVEKRLTPEQLEARAKERIAIQRQYTESMEINPKDLFSIYERMGQENCRNSLPVNLTAIWQALTSSRYLAELGCQVLHFGNDEAMGLSEMEGIPRGTVLTVSRELYDTGVPDQMGKIHFASYGDPFFDRLIQLYTSYPLPDCIRRIAVPVPGFSGAEMVAFGVACKNSEGIREIRLVKSWQDLQNMNLDEDAVLGEEEVEVLKEELSLLAWDEFKHYAAAMRIERENEKAAHGQEILNLLVGHSLLWARAGFGGDEPLFWPAIKEVEALFTDRESVLAPDIPVAKLKPVADMLVINCHIPAVGDKLHLSVPRILGTTSVDAAKRLADGMKAKKSELRAQTVLARMEREIEQKWKMIR